jgi:hypothetical protein
LLAMILAYVVSIIARKAADRWKANGRRADVFSWPKVLPCALPQNQAVQDWFD